MVKNLLIGLGVYLLGFIVVALSVSLFNGSPQFSYLRAISFAILYLASVIAICSTIIMKKLIVQFLQNKKETPDELITRLEVLQINL